MKVTFTWWDRQIDLVHAGITWVMRFVANARTLTPRQRCREVGRLAALFRRVARCGLEQETIVEKYKTLGLVPVTYRIHTRCRRLRDSLTP